MIVKANLVADSNSSYASLQSDEKFKDLVINFTITPKSGEERLNFIIDDGITAVATASVDGKQFDRHLRDKRPPHSVYVEWQYEGTDMGVVNVRKVS